MPSSFEVSKIANLKLSFSFALIKSFAASTKAATEDFISAAPLPYRKSPSIVAEKGG